MSHPLLDWPHSFVLPAVTAAPSGFTTVKAEIGLEIFPARATAPGAEPEHAMLVLNLPADLRERLRASWAQSGLDPAPAMLTAFLVLLLRYSDAGSAEVASIAARRGDGARQIRRGGQIVQIVQSIASVEYAPELPFRRLYDAVDQALQISSAPERAVEHGGARPGVTFSYEHAAGSLAAAGRGELSLAVVEDGEQTALHWRFDTARATRKMVERMQHSLLCLLSAAAERPETPVGRLPLLGQDELAALLGAWSGSSAPFRQETHIQTLVEEQAAQSPDATALLFGGETLTYAGLNARANRLARVLRAGGVGPEVIVGVCMDRSIDFVVSILAIMKAGGAYLPLDPAYPAERLGYMVADAACATVLTHRATEAVAARLIEESGRESALICVDSPGAAARAAAEDSANLAPLGGAESLAYVIYTSGSTGRPKGVLLQHRGLVNFVAGQIRVFGITAASRLLQFASTSFDASVSEIFTTLVAGGTLCLAPRETLSSPHDLLDLLRDAGITIVTLPPSLLAVLPSGGLPDLQTIVSAGEACPWEVARRWAVGRRFLNAYGPTEATVGPTCYELADTRDHATYVPIGRPLPNYSVYILDRYMQPVPVGVVGELYIGGVSLARGYHNRPELTAERFVSWQPEAAPARRLYRTGDMARFLDDGNLEYIGRTDQQVKLRGFRIEPGEIEAALRGHPLVGDAVVVVREDEGRDQRLVAYVTPSERRPVELWPSVAEFFVYDELLYQAMTSDERRNESYRQALRAHVPGKVALDIGTGRHAILSRLAVECGAKHVYAVELLEASFLAARETIRQLGLEDRITIIHGDIRTVTLPEPIDVCVSEIVGAIGGSEAARQLINDAWRLMKPEGVMIPARSTTRLAAVTLPEELLGSPAFTPVSGHYVEQIFAQRGYAFDLRLCLRGVTEADLCSTVGVLEDLDFTTVEPVEYDRREVLHITRSGRLDGFLAWLNLYTGGGAPLDILAHEHCWLPVFFPAFSPGLEVSEGDRLELTVAARRCENGLNPDYLIAGRLIRQSGESVAFEYGAYHDAPRYRESPFYAQLFAGDAIPTRAPDAAMDAISLRGFLEQRLPAHMVPSDVVLLDELPMTVNGKVDRAALPAPLARAAAEVAAPRSELEATLLGIWARALGADPASVGIEDDFFALGGHSLQAAQLLTMVAEACGEKVSLRTLYAAPTVAAFALALSGAAPEAQALRLADEVQLDPAIVPPAPAADLAPSRTIFLTGATGFLGAHLLAELVRETDKQIVCLVRASSPAAAWRRLEQALEYYQLTPSGWRDRVVPVTGDLAQPRLGLSDQVYDRIAQGATAIYHAAAYVNHAHPYELLRTANVGATVEVLRLATAVRLKHVHYVSTLAVLSGASEHGCVAEGQLPAGCHSPMGYVQTKWVSEGILGIARGRGIPVSVYRPGRIGPHSVTGATNASDAFGHLLAACVRLGAAPEAAAPENLIPVDYAAAAIVQIGLQRRSQTFHLLSRQLTSWAWVTETARELGYDLATLPHRVWHERLAAGAADGDPVMQGLLMLLPADAAEAGLPDAWADTYSTENTESALSGRNLECRPFDRMMLAHMLAGQLAPAGA